MERVTWTVGGLRQAWVGRVFVLAALLADGGMLIAEGDVAHGERRMEGGNAGEGPDDRATWAAKAAARHVGDAALTEMAGQNGPTRLAHGVKTYIQQGLTEP